MNKTNTQNLLLALILVIINLPFGAQAAERPAALKAKSVVISRKSLVPPHRGHTFYKTPLIDSAMEAALEANAKDITVRENLNEYGAKQVRKASGNRISEKEANAQEYEYESSANTGTVH